MYIVSTKNEQEWYDTQKFANNRDIIWGSGRKTRNSPSSGSYKGRLCIFITNNGMSYGTIRNVDSSKRKYIVSYDEFIKSLTKRR